MQPVDDLLQLNLGQLHRDSLNLAHEIDDPPLLLRLGQARRELLLLHQLTDVAHPVARANRWVGQRRPRRQARRRPRGDRGVHGSAQPTRQQLILASLHDAAHLHPQGGDGYRRCEARSTPPLRGSGGVGLAYVYEAGATHFRRDRGPLQHMSTARSRSYAWGRTPFSASGAAVASPGPVQKCCSGFQSGTQCQVPSDCCFEPEMSPRGFSGDDWTVCVPQPQAGPERPAVTPVGTAASSPGPSAPHAINPAWAPTARISGARG